MCFDGSGTNHQHVGDLPVRQALGDEHRDLALAFGESTELLGDGLTGEQGLFPGKRGEGRL